MPTVAPAKLAEAKDLGGSAPIPPPLDEAFRAFGSDPVFAGHRPTREQVARAWAFAKFKNEDQHSPPSHAQIVGALKKLFPEFRSSKPKTDDAHENSRTKS